LFYVIAFLADLEAVFSSFAGIFILLNKKHKSGIKTLYDTNEIKKISRRHING